MGKLNPTELALLSYAVSNAIILVGNIAHIATTNTNFEYNIDENGNLEVSGQIKSSVLNNCYLVERKDETGKLGLCVINKDGVDILNDEFVTSIHEVEGCLVSVDDNVYSVAKIGKYMEIEEDKLFSSDDIREMLRVIGENFTWHEYKVLSYTY